MTSFLPLLLIILAFFFLLIRPQRARAKQLAQVQAALIPGSEVITTAGMFGTVTAVDAESVTLEVAPGVPVRFLRAAIGKVVPPAGADADTAGRGGSTAKDSSAGDTRPELPPDDRPPA